MRSTSDGLIIKERASGESDKLLTVLTADRGKILICAKGVRSLKSKNASICRAFTYANLEYYEKNGMFWLASGEVKEHFLTLGTPLEALSLAAYIADVADELSGENFSDTTLLRLLLNTFFAIENSLRPYPLIKGAFEFFAAAHAGFAPDLSSCEKCGKGIGDTDKLVLDVMNGSLLCSECIADKRIPLTNEIAEYDRFETKNVLLPVTPEVIMAIRYAVSADLKRLYSFTLNKESDLSLFSSAGEVYLQNHLERGFETLNFYHDVIR